MEFIEKFLERGVVLEMVGMKKSWLHREIKAKRFPCPIPIGSARRWALSDVEEWMQKQMEAAKKEDK